MADNFWYALNNRLRQTLGSAFVEMDDPKAAGLANYAWALRTEDADVLKWINSFVESNEPRLASVGPDDYVKGTRYESIVGDRSVSDFYLQAVDAREQAGGDSGAVLKLDGSGGFSGPFATVRNSDETPRNRTTEEPDSYSGPFATVRNSDETPQNRTFAEPTTTPSGSGGGGGGGGGTYGGGGGGTTGGGSDQMSGMSGRMPPGYEVWKVDGESYLVYFLPDSSVPMAWRVTGDVETITGGRVDRTLSGKRAAAEGMMPMGRHSDLVYDEQWTDDPFEAFLEGIEERSTMEPWLTDPEVVVQAAEAYLEGRSVTLSDMMETEWYNSKTDKQRAWIQTAAQTSAAELQQIKDDRAIQVKGLLEEAGVSNPPPQLVEFLAEADLSGKFSNAEFAQQITAIADPYSGIKMDKEVKKALGGMDLVTSASDIRQMRQTVESWLGPFAASYTDRQLEEWAGMVRNDPNGGMKVEEILKAQRMALLPEYENPNVKWEDAAAPWQQWLGQQWGEPVDMNNDTLLKVVRANDVTEAKKIALSEGMRQGVGGATRQVASALGQAFGDGVRGGI